MPKFQRLHKHNSSPVGPKLMKLCTHMQILIMKKFADTNLALPVARFPAILNLVKNSKFPKDPRFFDFDKIPLAHIIYGPLSSI